MTIRLFALIFGIVFLLIGIAGFIPGLIHTPAFERDLAVGQGYGYLFGLFPVNVLHNLVHLAFGIWGILAYRGLGAAVTYARVVAIAYGLLAIMGFIPVLNTVFGLVPIYGHDIWLHAVLAIVAAYFGWFHHEPKPVRSART
jgi:hypothetical protein